MSDQDVAKLSLQDAPAEGASSSAAPPKVVKEVVDPVTGQTMSQAAYKKLVKQREGEAKKRAKEEERRAAMAEEDARKQAEIAARRAEAAAIVIEEDASLPAAIRIKVRDVAKFEGQRVKILGWVQHKRQQGRALMFFDVRDGTGMLQCTLQDKLAQCLPAVDLVQESSVAIHGKIQRDERAPGGFELRADYWRVIAASDESFNAKLNEDANVDTLLINRHLVHRGTRLTTVFKMRDQILREFRGHFFDKGFTEVMPPTLVQTQCEGGSTLFSFNYFNEEAYLTQSSQLYLETVIPSLGDVFCVLPSYRAEKSKTPRHLAEFTHFEAEMPFIEFEDLLNTVEDMVYDVSRRIAEKFSDEIHSLNPDFKVWPKPYKRMKYSECIEFCRAHNIYKDPETKEHFEFGDDIPALPERQMIDLIGEPVLMTHFPAEMKAFYMQRAPEDPTLTESVDLLVPGVGEIVGASMRMWDEKELLAAFARQNIDPAPYYWYTDQRKYGSCPHGGFGLGIERYLMWVLAQKNVREVCLYPRWMGHCKP
nr:asparagine-tRNA ligase [Seculamonas ecuadoriensis]